MSYKLTIIEKHEDNNIEMFFERLVDLCNVLRSLEANLEKDDFGIFNFYIEVI